MSNEDDIVNLVRPKLFEIFATPEYPIGTINATIPLQRGGLDLPSVPGLAPKLSGNFYNLALDGTEDYSNVTNIGRLSRFIAEQMINQALTRFSDILDPKPKKKLTLSFAIGGNGGVNLPTIDELNKAFVNADVIANTDLSEGTTVGKLICLLLVRSLQSFPP